LECLGHIVDASSLKIHQPKGTQQQLRGQGSEASTVDTIDLSVSALLVSHLHGFAAP
jgi:hypothetical protein